MVKSRLLTALLLAAVTPQAIAVGGAEFNELVACDKEHDPYGPDKLAAERVGNRLIVTGWAGMACGEHVANPKAVPDWGSLTLQIESKSADGVVAACRCTSKFQFLITDEVPTGRTIYLVKDGKGAAHAVAP